MVLIKGMVKGTSCGGCEFDKMCDKWKNRNWGAPPPDACPLISVDDVVGWMKAKMLSSELGDYEGNRDVYNFNCGIDACIAILRGLEGNK